MDALFGRSGEIDRSARLVKHSLKHRFKGLEWHRSEIWIKGDLVEQAAEFFGLLEIRVPPGFFARVPVETQIVEEVISLKDRVMLDDPVVFLRHEGLDDGGRDIRVVVGPKRIADIVQQGAYHILFVAGRWVRAGRGLQTMPKTTDGEPAIVAAQ